MAVINEVTEVLHKIEARLYPNSLGKGEGAYVARSKAEAPLSIEDICASAKNRGGFTGQYEDLVEHAHIFINEMVYQLLDGFSAQCGGYFSIHTRIGGTYHGAHDTIDAKNLSITFRELTKLKELLAKVKVENEGPAGDGAYIGTVTDTHTGAAGGTITPGNMIRISGNKIRVEGADEKCGVWLVNQTDGARTKVGESLAVNRTIELVALLPALSPGHYKLEIVTQYSGGTMLKEPRVITAESILVV